MRALKVSTRPLCLFGHTHYPVTFELSADERSTRSGQPSPPRCGWRCVAGSKYLVNPGSVGQPRDGDPRAAYAIVDTEAQLRRAVPAGVSASKQTQAKIIEAGLPEVLAQRLAVGR